MGEEQPADLHRDLRMALDFAEEAWRDAADKVQQQPSMPHIEDEEQALMELARHVQFKKGPRGV